MCGWYVRLRFVVDEGNVGDGEWPLAGVYD